MEKLLVLTDLHITPKGDTIIGLDPLERFKSVLCHSLEHHGDARCIILMGDLSHFGDAESYERLQSVLGDCRLPVVPMLGNHDRRDTFDAAFPNAPRTKSGHIQTYFDTNHHRIITLDTLDGPPYPTGHHSGLLCPDRLSWLDAALDGAGHKMPIVFSHHPPFDTGIVGMDAIQMQNGDALLDRLSSRNAHLFFGHLHRYIAGTQNTVHWTCFKSPCHQGPLDLHTEDSSLSIDEPGGYGVVLLPENGVIAHMQDVGFSVQATQDAASLT